ncbi:16S rRNA (cytosine(1402)-N(4))-methyltransferase RsmH [Metallumcola ferriviriculae]|uniref:Ribosomal RNA small subunit methyltransferase H n=1 Tax=Metallumcola ferriviriculae TaxID=3039180 RepID=A0AAU0UP43_9FIRM|nr:16S rRNA (cytosine(1402)-N(4))-methyltransferase RsmH [Desulfitibacteraceae bacterium MK1]
MEFYHRSVMLQECMELLKIKPNGIYFDCTLGGGGHGEAIAEKLNDQGLLVGLDQDEDALEAAEGRLQQYSDKVKIVRSNFRYLGQVAADLGITQIDGFLFDLGISSYQVDQADRGFSYQQEAPLDMRMDKQQVTNAGTLVNELSEAHLAEIIKNYGEERWAARIASFIVNFRANQHIETTTQLVDIIKKAIPAGARKAGPHPAKRTFQALRIAVNSELDVISEALKQGVGLLSPRGRIVVISFHSLEDRIVKQTFRDMAQSCKCPPGFPVCTCGVQKQVRIVTSKPVIPSEEEVNANPRARSAKVRAAEKL